MLINREAERDNYDCLISIWKRSVKSTHLFLKERDRWAIEQELVHFFNQVTCLIWYEEGNPQSIIGFSGTQKNHLEMLFLDPHYFGKGYGTIIVKWLQENKGIQTVDVNKQNERATDFYLQNGFEIISESPVDGQGMPYPLYHMKLVS